MTKQAILSLALFLSATAWGGHPVSVYIAAGQSNTDGRAEISGLPDYMKGGFRHLRYANVTSGTDGTFGDFTFSSRFCYQDVVNYLLDQEATADFYAIKCAVGGTSITPGATHAFLPVWCADSAWIAASRPYDGTREPGQSLTLSLTEGFRALAHTTLSKLRQGYRVRAVMWHQGESDRHKHREYHDALRTMINYIRQAIYSVTGKKRDLTVPFILGGVPSNSRQYHPDVENAKRHLAAEMKNVYYLNLDGTPLRADSLHFNGEGTVRVGRLMYEKLKAVAN